MRARPAGLGRGRAADGIRWPGWICGDPQDYDREYCVDLAQLSAFLHETQPEVAEALDLDEDGPTRRKFLARLQGEITKRGTIDVLRHGIKHGPHDFDLFYGTPSPGNPKAEERYGANRFSVTRQLRYSRDETQLALDLGLFINGLPVATFELKNSLTKQTVEDAVQQYKRDRDPRERLFEFGRCVVHFAVDDHEVRFCTQLKGKASWFLPFNLGWNDGAGNPPNPDGPQDRLPVEAHPHPRGPDRHPGELRPGRRGQGREDRPQEGACRSGRATTSSTWCASSWPMRGQNGAGRRYLIQHSAGSGKSNSIAWLAHQLIGLEKDGAPVFDSIIVVTDRRILDQQIRDTIKQFAQVGATVGHAEHSGDLRKFIEGGKKIIISTVQKFPFILDEIGGEHRGRRFAIIIDEAHSSQGGKTSAAISDGPWRDRRRGRRGRPSRTDQPEQRMQAKKMLPNASYFAFTATPKNKTLEIFGEPDPQPDGTVKHRPFHSYTMKQAIQEGFILDVLQSLHAGRELLQAHQEGGGRPGVRHQAGEEEAAPLRREPRPRHPAQGRDHGRPLPRAGPGAQEDRRAGAGHGGDQRHRAGHPVLPRHRRLPGRAQEPVPGHRRLLGRARLVRRGGAKVTEASLNGFPSGQIADKIQEDPYRFLVCADKFQTGYDEPLLHTMYVDKPLSGIKAVQTLSRLNRAHPQKHDVFVLDFMNDSDTIQQAFSDYYRTTILAEETDPNKLHDLKAALDGYQVYMAAQVEDLVELYLGGAERDTLDPILDACVAVYKDAARRGRSGRLQGQGQGVPAHLRLPRVDPALHQRGLGEALDLPELPGAQAAGPGRGGPVQGHPRSHRHGQLPGREAGGGEDPAPRRGR